MMTAIPSLESIYEAARRIEAHIHQTPVLTSSNLNQLFNNNLFFKCENFQKTGSFKFRGACNTVLSLSDSEAKQGVITHSSGNHAQALALAASIRRIKADIIMPETAPAIKKAAVSGYGAQITYSAPTQQSREQALFTLREQTGAQFIHSSNDLRVMTGQGTAALELLKEIDNLDMIIAPLGGGGLLSGTALATHYLSPKTEVIGAEPAGADDAFRSLQAGQILPSLAPKTIADGLLMSLGSNTFPVIQKYVKAVVTVDDKHILKAMRLIWERLKIIVEPSAAITLAVLLAGKTTLQNKRIGIILSGGNIDLDKLYW